MAIDEATLLEIERLKNEIKLKDMALEEEKKAYQKQLLRYCRQIKEELENPPKPSLILKWKVMWARWKIQAVCHCRQITEVHVPKGIKPSPRHHLAFEPQDSINGPNLNC